MHRRLPERAAERLSATPGRRPTPGELADALHTDEERVLDGLGGLRSGR